MKDIFKIGEGVMKKKSALLVLLTITALSFLFSSCVNNSQSVYIKKFIPYSTQDSCEIKIDSIYYYTDGYIDIGLTDQYFLPFLIKNEMLYSAEKNKGGSLSGINTGDAQTWIMNKVILDFELPPISEFSKTAWGKRELRQSNTIEANGGEAVDTVPLLTQEQYKDLWKVFFSVNFDWARYPIIVTVTAEGETRGGRSMATNSLKFNLVPAVGIGIMANSVYPIPDGGFGLTDEEIQKLPVADRDKAIYDRDLNEYNAITEYCGFAASPIEGCIIGNDATFVNCYAASGIGEKIKDIYDYYGYDVECCPQKAPTKPTEPKATGTI